MVLLDTGILFAAAHQSHESHAMVRDWLRTQSSYATCGLTQVGLFRLLLNPVPMRGSPLGAAAAHIIVREFTSSERHVFISCPPLSEIFVGKTDGHRAAADDYLVQIAAAADYKLATLDRALSRRRQEYTLLVH